MGGAGLQLAFLAVALAASPAELEKRGLRHVMREFERVGRNTPVADPVLTDAARRLAREALVTGADEAADLLAIAQEVSAAGGFDPTPRAVVVRATPADYALETFLARTDYNEQPTTHVGVAVIQEKDRAVIVALLSERKARLDAFPRKLAGPGETHKLCGELRAPLRTADLYVTRPRGEVDKVPLTRQDGPRFCAAIPFPERGRHSVEVVGRGERGPEVAAIFFVDAGAAPGQLERAKIAEPDTLAAARDALLIRINGLRHAHGLPPVALDPRLNEVAQQHSDQMAAEGFFAHVSPQGADLRARLVKARYAYSRAGENLGLAAGPLAAHFAIEHSPGHRRNLLDGDFTAVGVGVAYEEVGGRRQVLLTEVLARPVIPPADPIAAAYRVLSERRATKGLGAMRRSPVLEAIAVEHARRALALDQPRVSLPGGAPVHDKVFEAMAEVKSAAVDFFVADDPSAVPESKSAEDPRNDTVGLAAVKGDSPTYGPDKYWVVVIYAATSRR